MLSQVIERESKLLSVNKENVECFMCGSEKTSSRKSLCETCDFWSEKLEIKNNKNVARVANEHYIIGDSNSKFKGFGGTLFAVKFNDGRVVPTDNLWHQGRIPIVWRKRLPNNATFVDQNDLSDKLNQEKGDAMTFFTNTRREWFGLGVVLGLVVALVVVKFLA